MKRCDKRAKYEGLLRRREREGLSYRELARESGVPAGTLAWWAQRLGQERSEGGVRPGPRFVELVAREAAAGSAVRYEIQLLSGRRVLVEGAFQDEALARLVAVLERPCWACRRRCGSFWPARRWTAARASTGCTGSCGTSSARRR